MENVFYYFGLYLIVLIVKIAKHVKKYKSDELRSKWTEILEVSLDLTFAASGCVIALLINVDKNWIPVVYIISTLILLISAFMEFLSDRLKKVRPYLNSAIILTIFLCTYALFMKVIPNVDNSGHTIEREEEIKSDSLTNFIVIIPFKDESLISNHGYGKMGDLNFMFKVEIQDSIPSNAKSKAIEIFKKDSDIKPVLNIKGVKKNGISIQESNILVLKDPK